MKKNKRTGGKRKRFQSSQKRKNYIYKSDEIGIMDENTKINLIERGKLIRDSRKHTYNDEELRSNAHGEAPEAVCSVRRRIMKSHFGEKPSRRRDGESAG